MEGTPTSVEPPCECPESGGLCPRYGIEQRPHHVRLCQSSNNERAKLRRRKDERDGVIPKRVIPLLPSTISPISDERQRIHVQSSQPSVRMVRGKCVYTGAVLIKIPNCGGSRWTYECDHPNDTKQSQHPTCIPIENGQTCPHWSDHIQPETSLEENSNSTPT